MQIQYLGLSSFKFITKEAVVFSDPFGKETGYAQPRGNADIVLLSEPKNPIYSGYSSLSGDTFLVDSPGEYDRKGVTIAGIPVKHEDKYITIWLIENEGVKILDLSHISNFLLSEDELSGLGNIDILIVPVGGGDVLDSSQAAKIAHQIESAIIIPSHYQLPDCKLKLEPVELFLRELGNKFEKVDKLIVKKKDFTDTETSRVVVLENIK